MPIAIPPSNPPVIDTIGLRSVTVQTHPVTGVVSAVVTPAYWSGEVFVSPLQDLVFPNVTVWITKLYTASDALAGEAAMRFARVKDDLLWLTRLELSAKGKCARPEPTPAE